jgi:hypothetical protein
VGRTAAPGSELAMLHLRQLYRITNPSFKHKQELETFLFARERSLFDFVGVITIYDLTTRASREASE